MQENVSLPHLFSTHRHWVKKFPKYPTNAISEGGHNLLSSPLTRELSWSSTPEHTSWMIFFCTKSIWSKFATLYTCLSYGLEAISLSSSSSAPLIPRRKNREIQQHQLTCSLLGSCMTAVADIKYEHFNWWKNEWFPRTGRLSHGRVLFKQKHWI